MKKRSIKRLTHLKIDSVDAVDRGAGEGVKIMLMKRAPGFDGAYGLLGRNGKPRWQRKAAEGTGGDDSLQKALAEIEETRAFVKAAAPLMGDTMQTREVDVVKAMSSRIAEIRKADPSIRSDNHALLKLSESRAESDQTLWRSWKKGVVSASTVHKAIDPEKAIRKMVKRCDELMAADPSVRSRESAIAKVASSRLETDQKIWKNYRAGAQATDESALPSSSPAPVGKSMADLAMANMVEALMASYPHLSVEAARRWAEKIMRGAPPAAALTQRTADARG